MESKERLLCEYLESEFGGKPIIVRHDVDNIYPIYGGSTKHKILKVINYGLLFALSISLKFRYLAPGYEYHIWELLDIEENYSAKGTFFFRPVTIPKKGLLKELKKLGYEIAYHSDRNKDFSKWYSDLKLVEKYTKTKIEGFTKHGYSKIRDGGEWNEQKFISFASKAHLRYLAQGSDHPDWNLPRKISRVWVFGHHKTLKKTGKEQLLEYLENSCLPMVMLHPEDLSIKGEKEKLDIALSKGVGIRVIDAVNKLEKFELEEAEA